MGFLSKRLSIKEGDLFIDEFGNGGSEGNGGVDRKA
jgi:hypothetical protein